MGMESNVQEWDKPREIVFDTISRASKSGELTFVGFTVRDKFTANQGHLDLIKSPRATELRNQLSGPHAPRAGARRQCTVRYGARLNSDGKAIVAIIRIKIGSLVFEENDFVDD